MLYVHEHHYSLLFVFYQQKYAGYSILAYLKNVFQNDGLTDRTTEEPMDGRTDKPAYRDAWTHLKMDLRDEWEFEV